MSLLMPDINLRRAKLHLERYWRQVLGGDKPVERKRLAFRFKSDKMSRSKVAQRSSESDNPVIADSQSTGNLDVNGGADGIGESSKVKAAAPLDCEAAPRAMISSDDGEDNKQNAANTSALYGKDSQLDGSQQTLSSTSTTGSSTASGTACSGSSSTVVSTTSSGDYIGKPPLAGAVCRGSRGNRGSYPPPQMPKPQRSPRAEGPTLGTIMQRVHTNDGDVRELDFSSLALRKKCLGADGCALVARALATNHTVRKLIIRDHAIGDDGAVAVSRMLCSNTTLQSLDLLGNNISDHGAAVLAQTLYGHDSVTHLSLKSNRITDKGAKALAQAVRCNCTLKSLDLDYNKITRSGAQALLDALDVNSYLETVSLEGNDVPPSIASQLAAALARNRAESLILESQAAEEMAENLTYKASTPVSHDEEDSSDDDEANDEDEYWEEEDDDDSVSSGFLSCSGVTDIPLSSSGLWI